MKIMRLGTSVKISVIFDEDVDSATIIIKDPGLMTKIASTAMTKEQNNVYSYIFQSATTDIDGEYEVDVTAIKGSYTAYSKSFFTLET